MNFRPLCWLTVLLLAGCATSPPPASPMPPVEVPGETGPAEPPITAPRPPPAAPIDNTEAPTLALLRQSERSADSGDLDSAIGYVERAIRLNSRDPALWLRLARLQLEARRPAQAEQLAHKAIALAEDDAAQREGWLLVADALDAQGDDTQAAAIRERWRTFKG